MDLFVMCFICACVNGVINFNTNTIVTATMACLYVRYQGTGVGFYADVCVNQGLEILGW